MECSVLSGEVQRTWHTLGKDGKTHTIDLYHDTLSGTRSVAVDLAEVEGSLGTTPFYSRQSTTIPFTVAEERGVIIIDKAGLLATSFRYTCLVGGTQLRATLQDIAGDEERYSVCVVNTASTYESAESAVTWYQMTVERKSDGSKTVVHRRYKEFSHMFDQVEAAFKGHHLRSSLPPFPGKQLKILVDHNDPAFIEERRVSLDGFMGKLLGVPHVSSMLPVQIFLGFFEQIKEHSAVFREKDLGLALEVTKGGAKKEEENIVVTSIQGEEARGTCVMVGDSISKVNGEVVSDFGLDRVRQAIGRGPRPIVLHFLQPVFKNPGHQISANFEPQPPFRVPAGAPAELKKAVAPPTAYMPPQAQAEAPALPSARAGGSLSSVAQGTWGPQHDFDGDDDATAL